MQLFDVNDLLKPGYLSLESGYERLPDGSIMVAALSRVHGCSGAMLQWWFNRAKSPEEFVKWHPLEHVTSEHREGRFLVVHRRGEEILRGTTQSIDPADVFDGAALAGADVSFVSCARGGPADRNVWAMRMVHVGRDTADGCEVRSRFWMGVFDPAESAPPRDVVEKLFSDENAAWQMKHAIEEFYYASQLLPALYAREAR